MSAPSQFGAEFRRFSLDRSKPGRFDEFYGLLQHVHRIPNVELLVAYADVHGDLLPINNDDNYYKAISTANPLLRLFLQRKGKRKCSHRNLCLFVSFLHPKLKQRACVDLKHGTLDVPDQPDVLHLF